MSDLGLTADAALLAMAAVGVHVKLTDWRTSALAVSGLPKAPEWRTYIVERKHELAWCLLRRNRAAWRAFSTESLNAYRAGLSRGEQERNAEPINRGTSRKRR